MDRVRPASQDLLSDQVYDIVRQTRYMRIAKPSTSYTALADVGVLRVGSLSLVPFLVRWLTWEPPTNRTRLRRLDKLYIIIIVILTITITITIYNII